MMAKSPNPAIPSGSEESQASRPGEAIRPTSSESQGLPAATVIVAAFNSAGYIVECLGSLKGQTFRDFEAIVVDDGSTDDTVDVVERFIAGDGRFVLVKSECNGGPGAARNKALDRARGEYVLYVDADDRLVADALEKLIGRARAQRLDELVYSAATFYEGGSFMQVKPEDYSGRDAFDGVGTGPEMLTFHSERGQYYASGALRMVRRGLLEENSIRFPEGIIHEDELYSFFIAAASKRSSFLDEPLYLRRQRLGSIMGAQYHTASSVIGVLTSICVVRRWVAEHADELDDAFARSIGRIVAQWSRVVARDWNANLTESEREQIAQGLFAEAREELFFNILGTGDVIEEAADEYRSSQTYRLGDALVRGPRAIRDRAKALLDRRRIENL